MKWRKRGFVLILVIALVLTGGAFEPVKASAATIKLNKTKVLLRVGQTYRLKLKGVKAVSMIRWKSSKKKIAIVSQRGLIKAKKKGKAKITAIYGKKKYVCKLTVKKMWKVDSATVTASKPAIQQNPTMTPANSTSFVPTVVPTQLRPSLPVLTPVNTSLSDVTQEPTVGPEMTVSPSTVESTETPEMTGYPEETEPSTETKNPEVTELPEKTEPATEVPWRTVLPDLPTASTDTPEVMDSPEPSSVPEQPSVSGLPATIQPESSPSPEPTMPPAVETPEPVTEPPTQAPAVTDAVPTLRPKPTFDVIFDVPTLEPTATPIAWPIWTVPARTTRPWGTAVPSGTTPASGTAVSSSPSTGGAIEPGGKTTSSPSSTSAIEPTPSTDTDPSEEPQTTDGAATASPTGAASAAPSEETEEPDSTPATVQSDKITVSVVQYFAPTASYVPEELSGHVLLEVTNGNEVWAGDVEISCDFKDVENNSIDDSARISLHLMAPGEVRQYSVPVSGDVARISAENSTFSVSAEMIEDYGFYKASSPEMFVATCSAIESGICTVSIENVWEEQQILQGTFLCYVYNEAGELIDIISEDFEDINPGSEELRSIEMPSYIYWPEDTDEENAEDTDGGGTEDKSLIGGEDICLASYCKVEVTAHSFWETDEAAELAKKVSVTVKDTVPNIPGYVLLDVQNQNENWVSNVNISGTFLDASGGMLEEGGGGVELLSIGPGETLSVLLEVSEDIKDKIDYGKSTFEVNVTEVPDTTKYRIIKQSYYNLRYVSFSTSISAEDGYYTVTVTNTSTEDMEVQYTALFYSTTAKKEVIGAGSQTVEISAGDSEEISFEIPTYEYYNESNEDDPANGMMRTVVTTSKTGIYRSVHLVTDESNS